LVEGHGVFTAGGSAELGDDGICEVRPLTTRGESGSDERVLVNSEFAGIQEALDQLGGASGADL